MKASIEVSSRHEGDNIRAALEDDMVRAFVTVFGVLLRLPSDKARARVMQYVTDRLSDEGNKGEAT
jgi:hypothetical protein